MYEKYLCQLNKSFNIKKNMILVIFMGIFNDYPDLIHETDPDPGGRNETDPDQH